MTWKGDIVTVDIKKSKTASSSLLLLLLFSSFIYCLAQSCFGLDQIPAVNYLHAAPFHT